MSDIEDVAIMRNIANMFRQAALSKIIRFVHFYHEEDGIRFVFAGSGQDFMIPGAGKDRSQQGALDGFLLFLTVRSSNSTERRKPTKNDVDFFKKSVKDKQVTSVYLIRDADALWGIRLSFGDFPQEQQQALELGLEQFLLQQKFPDMTAQQ